MAIVRNCLRKFGATAGAIEGGGRAIAPQHELRAPGKPVILADLDVMHLTGAMRCVSCIAPVHSSRAQSVARHNAKAVNRYAVMRRVWGYTKLSGTDSQPILSSAQ